MPILIWKEFLHSLKRDPIRVQQSHSPYLTPALLSTQHCPTAPTSPSPLQTLVFTGDPDIYDGDYGQESLIKTLFSRLQPDTQYQYCAEHCFCASFFPKHKPPPDQWSHFLLGAIKQKSGAIPESVVRNDPWQCSRHVWCWKLETGWSSHSHTGKAKALTPILFLSPALGGLVFKQSPIPIYNPLLTLSSFSLRWPNAGVTQKEMGTLYGISGIELWSPGQMKAVEAWQREVYQLER